ncbi:hypothetical protein BVZ35_01678 [Haemophilus influenzae]|nr:hypothetical protein BVZ35_01678 [Haemophilus influenzae]PRL43374.1 hypothetical protein BV089_01762 [Haemophilus influenzae]PRL69515.1 hypothetical protein BV054_01683 [Haemophilus influenzae]
MLKIHQTRHLDFLLTIILIFYPYTITQQFIKRLITHNQVANIAFCRGFHHRINRTFRQLRIKFTHRLTQLLNKNYTAQIATGKFALMNRQIFTIAIFPTEGLQALKGELFDVVFVEHFIVLHHLIIPARLQCFHHDRHHTKLEKYWILLILLFC